MVGSIKYDTKVPKRNFVRIDDVVVPITMYDVITRVTERKFKIWQETEQN